MKVINNYQLETENYIWDNYYEYLNERKSLPETIISLDKYFIGEFFKKGLLWIGWEKSACGHPFLTRDYYNIWLSIYGLNEKYKVSKIFYSKEGDTNILTYKDKVDYLCNESDFLLILSWDVNVGLKLLTDYFKAQK